MTDETLERDLRQIDGMVRELAGTTQRLEGKVDRLNHLLDGNGEPGLRIRIDRLEKGVPAELVTRLDRVEQDRRTLRWFLGVVIAALVAIGLRVYVG